MLILYNIEGLVIVPAKLDCEVESVQAVVDCALVSTGAHCRVSEWSELVMIWREHSPSISCRSLENDDHKSSHEEGCIGLFGVVQASVMVYLVSAVLLIIDKLLKLLAEKMDFTKIEWAKISEEWLVHKVVVDAKVEGVRSRLGWILVRYPVQPLWYNLNRFVVTVCWSATPMAIVGRCTIHILVKEMQYK